MVKLILQCNLIHETNMHVLFKFKHSQSLIISISALRCDKFSSILQLLEAECLSFSFTVTDALLFSGPHARAPPMSRCFIFLPPFGGRAHLHGAISYVLRRPITRVDSRSDRKSCWALPNQTPHGYPDVAAHPTTPFS